MQSHTHSTLVDHPQGGQNDAPIREYCVCCVCGCGSCANQHIQLGEENTYSCANEEHIFLRARKHPPHAEKGVPNHLYINNVYIGVNV